MARIEPMGSANNPAPQPAPSHSGWRMVSAMTLVIMILAMLLSAGVPASAWAQGRRLALVVGVGVFQDQAFETLRYAASDARKMEAYLLDPKGGGFNAQDVTLLLNQQATKANILRQAKRIVRLSQPQDTVLLYFSSHGAYSQEQTAGIVCHDSRSMGYDDRFGPIARADSILSKEDLRRIIKRLDARKRALVVDVCYSAEATAGLSHHPPKQDGYPPDSDAESGPDKHAGAGAGEDQIILVMTSCMGRERAWESRLLGASIFTYYLIQGLRHHDGDLVEAFYYSQIRTQRQSSQEKGWCQMPYIIRKPPWQRLILAPPGKGEGPHARR